jgi:hypothetical protein
MTSKPVIFISHSALDKTVARVLQQQIEMVLDGKDKVTVFNSSDPFAIPLGRDWFEEIANQLDQAEILVVLVTASAKQSIWVGFEIGYFWNKTRGKAVYPVAVPRAKTFGPLEKLQAKSLGDSEEIDVFLYHICKDLGMGDPSKADRNSIIEEAIYNARYVISEVEIRARLREFLLNKYKSGEEVAYSDVDTEMDLPEGSTSEFLHQVASVPEIEEMISGSSHGSETFRYYFEDD